MKQKELNKTFMMISNINFCLVSMVYTYSALLDPYRPELTAYSFVEHLLSCQVKKDGMPMYVLIQ